MPKCRCGNEACCGLFFDNETYYCCACCPDVDCEFNDNWEIINHEPEEPIDWLIDKIRPLTKLSDI